MDTSATPSPPRDAAPSGARRLPRRYWLGTLAALVVGAGFLLAVYGKALDPDAFAAQIEKQGFDVLFSPHVVALGVLALEALLGLLLVMNVRRLWVLIPTLLLVLFFQAHHGWTWYQDAAGLKEPEAGCGCFGNLFDHTPAEAFWRDAALFLLPALLAFLGRIKGPPQPRRRPALAAALALGVLVFAIKAPDLPLDDMATRLKPGVKLADLCVGKDRERECIMGEGGLLSDLDEGTHLFVLSNLDEPEFLARAAEMNEQMDPPLWIVTGQEETHIQGLEWMKPPIYAPAEHLPPPLIRPLYRRLPRAFLVRDGVVVRTWSGMPPLPFTGEE